MAADLIKLAEAKAFGKLRGSEEDAILAAIIPAVSEGIRHWTGFDWDTRTYSEIRNGNGQVAMHAQQAGKPGPPITGTPTVQENGVNLVVALGYSTSADVIVDQDEGLFYRRPGTTSGMVLGGRPGRWAEGVQNLVFGYSSGYAQDSIPGDIKLVAKYATIMIWKHSDKKTVGIGSRAQGQGSVSLLEDLPDFYKRILDARRRVIQPAA